jgi:hypothetical protein
MAAHGMAVKPMTGTFFVLTALADGPRHGVQ